MLIETNRLYARRWTEADLPLALKLWGDADVMAMLDVRGALKLETVQEKLADEIERERSLGVQYWPWFERAGDAFVGCCGLKPWRHSPREGWELGFYLAKEMWGRGYAMEAATAVLHYAREKNIAPVLAGHHPRNENSRKILAKLGFEFLEAVLFKPTGLMHPSYRLPAR